MHLSHPNVSPVEPDPVAFRVYADEQLDVAEDFARKVVGANIESIIDQFLAYATKGTPMRPDLARDEWQKMLSDYAAARNVLLD